MALAAGATPDRISYGNTIKKERDIAAAFARGIRLFAVDCVEEVEKIARAAPGAQVFCRILCDGVGAEWPLSRKFGCAPEMAIDVLEHAHRLGLDAYGVSFHVGSQQPNPDAWDIALKATRRHLPHALRARHPAPHGQSRRRLPGEVPEGRAGGEDLWPRHLQGAPQAFRQPHPGDDHRARPRHGRRRRRHQGRGRAHLEEGGRRAARWVYLDIGKFGGLAETMDEAIRYPIRTAHDGDADERPASSPARPAIRPTCSTRRRPYDLPVSLSIGDEVLIEGTGAYTTTYSAVAFNGFEPLKAYVI